MNRIVKGEPHLLLRGTDFLSDEETIYNRRGRLQRMEEDAIQVEEDGFMEGYEDAYADTLEGYEQDLIWEETTTDETA